MGKSGSGQGSASVVKRVTGRANNGYTEESVINVRARGRWGKGNWNNSCPAQGQGNCGCITNALNCKRA